MSLESIVVLIIIVILIIVLLKFLFGILAILPAEGTNSTLKACPAIICTGNHTRTLVYTGNSTPGYCQPGICP